MTEQVGTPVSSSTTPPRPAFDPELIPALEAMGAVPGGSAPALSVETLPVMRSMLGESPVPGQPKADLTAGGLVTVEGRQVPGPPGGPDITVLILRPAETQGPVPGIDFMHPGGMVMGDRRFLVDPLVPYVAEGNAVVVSVEYRLAPEHPAPAPNRDRYRGP